MKDPKDLKVPVNSLSISPDNSLIICGGREILKILSISDLSESRSLRVGRTNLNYSAQDIAWHPSDSDCILSAARNSSIVLWNLKNSGTSALEKLYKGHKTMVNRVKWHPNLPDIFISAAQDGFIRIWDRRVPDESVSFFNCNSEGARDASFSLHKDFLIGASFDSGSVQILDWRKEQVMRKINAHKRLALTVDWHPIWPDRIASGGSDKYIKIWNSENGESIYKVQAPEAVARIKWLPKQPSHLASISHTHDNNLYIWDIENPNLPHSIYRGHSQPVKDFLLQPGGLDSLITCSDDGLVIDQTITNAYSPKNDRPKSLIAVGALNTLSFVTIKSSKTSLNLINIGNIKSDIESQADVLKIKGDVSECCNSNSELSNQKGVWKALGSLHELSKEETWLNSLIQESYYETIDHHTERGELQMAACIANVLDLKGPMKDYSGLLKQLELNEQAAKLPVVETNLEIFFRCKCGKTIEDGICQTCQNLAECSVCEGSVKGLYSWCQGCGHGGHAAHINGWFRSNSLCPTGCGHNCVSAE